MHNTAYIDVETCSRVSLVACGVDGYVEDDLFDIICAVVIIPSSNCVLLYRNPIITTDVPIESIEIKFSSLWASSNKLKVVDDLTCLVNFLKELAVTTFVAHNADFEHACLSKKNKYFKDVNWECTMTSANAAGLPAKLDNLAIFFDLPNKAEVGRSLIQRYSILDDRRSKPIKMDESDSLQFYGYNFLDVCLLEEVHKKLPYHNDKREYYNMTLKMNRIGLPVDVSIVNSMVTAINEYAALIEENLPINVRSPAQVKKYCQDYNVSLDTLSKSYLKEIDTTEYPKEVKDVLYARSVLSQSSTGKCKKILIKEVDGRLKGCFKYYGAMTGRDTASGVQPQTFPRGSFVAARELPYIGKLSFYLSTFLDPITGAKEGLRGVIRCSKGKTFFCADFANIEPRVLFFLSNQQDAIDMLVKGHDLYVRTAAQIYNIPRQNVSKEQRNLGKAAVLGLGYGMGVERFIATCQERGINLTQSLATKVHQDYRQIFPCVINFWNECKDCMIEACGLKSGTSFKVRNLVYGRDRTGMIYIQLPSGRRLLYFDMHVDCDTQDIVYYKFCHNGNVLNPENYKRKKSLWFKKERIYGAKIVDHVTQGTARDLYFNSCYELDRNGFSVVARIHDEVLCEVDDKDIVNTVDKGVRIMERNVPDWATNIPVKVEAWHGNFYHK